MTSCASTPVNTKLSIASNGGQKSGVSKGYPQLNARISHDQEEWLKAYKATMDREGTKLVATLLDALIAYCKANGNAFPNHPFNFQIACNLLIDGTVQRPPAITVSSTDPVAVSFARGAKTLAQKEARASRAARK